MSIEKLRETLADAVTDDFDMGTVIRWVAADKYRYTAIKTEIGWTTSARSINSFVPQVVDYEELVNILSRSEVRDVEVATSWEPVR